MNIPLSPEICAAAFDWYNHGLSINDPITRFMVHWVSFNWLYSGYKAKSQAGQIEAFFNDNDKTLLLFNAFSDSNCSKTNIFKKQPILDERFPEASRKASEARRYAIENSNDRERAKNLLLSILTVRNNLFHGEKSLHDPRTFELVRASSFALEGYIKVILESKYSHSAHDEDAGL